MISPPSSSSSSMMMMPTTTTTLLDLNQDLTLNHDDQEHQHLFATTHHHHQQQQPSSLSFPILLNPLPHQKVEKIDEANCSSGSRDHSEKPNHESSNGNGSGIIKLIWKNKKQGEAEAEEAEVIPKWMPSKMRMMRKMMVSDHHHHQHQQQEQEIPIIGTDDDNNNQSHNSTTATTVRVCSDCHTTKTPLWRSGPRGPKSLCNACGIRQRKARRAAMAAAAANGTTLAAAEASAKVNKFGRSKEKQLKSKSGSSELMKKKRNKLGAAGRGKQSHHHHHHNNDYCFEDLRLSLLSKNLAVHQVFPQDEKEAAILLMALSYGLLLG